MAGRAISSGVTSLDPSRFRQVLSHLPTGVTAVTAHRPSGPIGMACNSVTSVSLDPPLMLVCVGKSSETWPEIRAAGRFCVNVMAAHHEDTCLQFSRKGTERFAGIGWHPRPAGPALDDALAWIECSLRDEHDAGDHTIVVADVLAMDARASGSPLIFFRGRYGTFGPRRSLRSAAGGP
jgi:flavin reductase (DIM6/NTAB) family NADH-FMN oxidoreductase RutF